MKKLHYHDGKLYSITVSTEAYLEIRRIQAKAILKGESLRVWEAASKLILNGARIAKENDTVEPAKTTQDTTNYNFDSLDILDRINVKKIVVNLEEEYNLLRYAETKGEEKLYYSAYKTALQPSNVFSEKNPYTKHFNDLLVKSHLKYLAQSKGGQNGKRGPAIK